MKPVVGKLSNELDLTKVGLINIALGINMLKS